MGEMREFLRDDGASLQVVPGFRDRIHHWRPSVSPKSDWDDEDYQRAAASRVRRFEKRFKRLEKRVGSLTGASILEIGCGGGIDTLLTALRPVGQVVGIDAQLLLFDAGKKAARNRRLLSKALEQCGEDADVDAALDRLPVSFKTLDATQLPFPEESFDVIVSRASLEHVIPIEGALDEMRRIVRPGGFMHHSIDPFYWLRGCHAEAMVDIPWAHARLSGEEYQRFVHAYEGPDKAASRSGQIAELNQFTLERWREVVDDGNFEILEWEENPSAYAEEILGEFPEVLDTLLPGVGERDVICGQINTVMRRSRG